jgi:hypothetical protein
MSCVTRPARVSRDHPPNGRWIGGSHAPRVGHRHETTSKLALNSSCAQPPTPPPKCDSHSDARPGRRQEVDGSVRGRSPQEINERHLRNGLCPSLPSSRTAVSVVRARPPMAGAPARDASDPHAVHHDPVTTAAFAFPGSKRKARADCTGAESIVRGGVFYRCRGCPDHSLYVCGFSPMVPHVGTGVISTLVRPVAHAAGPSIARAGPNCIQVRLHPT